MIYGFFGPAHAGKQVYALFGRADVRVLTSKGPRLSELYDFDAGNPRLAGRFKDKKRPLVRDLAYSAAGRRYVVVTDYHQ